MSLLQILFFVVTNLGSILKIVRAIAGFIRSQNDKKTVNATTKELGEAVEVYRRTRDKRPLEALLCRLQGSC